MKAPTTKDKLLNLLLKILPQHLLSGIMYKLARIRWSPFKNILINRVVKLYGINLEDASSADLDSYSSFNAFFTRTLKPGARPIAPGDNSIACPADGRVNHAGYVTEGQLIQAKGHEYGLLELLAGDQALFREFKESSYATVYLSPRDYHRVHMPVTGRLREMHFVPGKLFSVSEATTQLVPELFARNERVICVFDTATGIICFEASEGEYDFIATAVDRCGETASDTVHVSVTQNELPTVILPDDFAQLVCQDSALCFYADISDSNPGNGLTVEVIPGPGSYDPATGEVCVAVDSSGTYVVIVRATDPCGASAEDTVTIAVTLNSAPVWTLVPQVDTAFCVAPQQLCLQTEATDPDGEQVHYRLLAGPGSMDSLTGVICFTPDAESNDYTFYVLAYDSCGAMAIDTATASVWINRAPVFEPTRDTLLSKCLP